jgi:hypothetical protein
MPHRWRHCGSGLVFAGVHPMTDQLMDDLTNEEHEALLLMSEHAIAPPLSPAAQAVLDGFRAVPTLMDGPSIAGALRAAANQVVPAERKPSADSDYHLMNWSKSLDQYAQRQQTRAELLAIADELEGQ